MKYAPEPIATYGKRLDCTLIQREAIGTCAVSECGEIAYSENCNAEGNENRMHWHGGLHVRSPRFGNGVLCPRHAEEARENNRGRAARLKV